MNLDRNVWNLASPASNARKIMFSGLVVLICYGLAIVAHALTIPPDHVSLFWPTTSLLVALLLMSPSRTWLTLLAAGLVGTALGDLQVGIPAASIVRFLFADTVAVVVAIFMIERTLPGLPCLTTLKTFGKYALATVILAAPAGAIFGANASAGGSYWVQWSLWSFSEALAFVTVAPALLTWVREGREWLKKPRNYFELASILTLLLIIGWRGFAGSERLESATIVYLLVPLLLWATLRLGLKGVSLSLVIVSFFSIWGASHGRGPFTEHGSSISVLSLQLFLLFAAAPFIALALIVEEHKCDRRALIRDIAERKRAEGELRESEERLRLALRAGKMYAFDWDVATDVVIRSERAAHLHDLTGDRTCLTHKQLLARVHPEDRATFTGSIAVLTPEKPDTHTNYRVLRPDGSMRWLERSGHAFFDEQGKLIRMIGIVADITEHKLAESRLQEYEKAVEGVQQMITVIDREYRYLLVNNEFLKTWKATKVQIVGHWLGEILNEGAFEAVVKEKLDECFQGNVVRYEMKATYPEIGERNICVSYFPVEGPTGVDRVACIVQDVTEQKRTEKALSTVSQRLIEAQEQERSRLARELHDDINQRVALLGVTLSGLKHRVPAESIELRQKIEETSQQISDVGADIQALSHRLHSSKLEYLGLEKAASGFCKEFSEQQGVEIDFQSKDVLGQELPQEISLCLFRVLQEALQNAAKHSGSRHFQVLLKANRNEIELTVHDSGIGFQPDQAIKGRGLGLTSMQERLKLVEGYLSIESEPQNGTTVRARAPLQLRTAVALVSE